MEKVSQQTLPEKIFRKSWNFERKKYELRVANLDQTLKSPKSGEVVDALMGQKSLENCKHKLWTKLISLGVLVST